MDRQELANVIHAYAEGWPIQFRYNGKNGIEGNWNDDDEPQFWNDNMDFRVSPEMCEPEEVQLGNWRSYLPRINAQTVAVKARNVLADCIENGIAIGYNRAHKHVDDPSEQMLKISIEHAIWNEIDDYFLFDEGE